MAEIRVRDTCEADCDECGKARKGVRFVIEQRFAGETGEAFLCWEHFRLTLDAMTRAGILAPQPECNHSTCGLVCDQRRPSDTRHPRRSETWGESYTRIEDSQTIPRGEAST